MQFLIFVQSGRRFGKGVSGSQKQKITCIGFTYTDSPLRLFQTT